MKTCSYCGRQNDDTAIACSECGTGMVSLPAPEVDAQLTDPAAALVIVGTFDTMAQASLLLTRLEAAGIETCTPEEYGTQLFSNVIPLGCVTVRVAAKEFEAAKAIAVAMAETDPSSAAESVSEKSSPSAPARRTLSGPEERAGLPSKGFATEGLTRQAVGVITTIVVAMPMIFGVIAHLIRESAAMGLLFWLWALFSITCLIWARHVFRKYRPLAWGCVAVGLLQLISFLLLFIAVDLPANSRSVPFTPPPTRNRHNW